MSRIILLKGQSNYGSLRLHTDQLSNALTNLGYNNTVIDLTQSDAYQKLDELIQEPIDFFFSFNAIGIDMTAGPNNESVYNLLKVPFVAALVDHPHMHIERITKKIDQLYITALDQSHIDFMTNYLPQNAVKAQLLFPPGGNRNLSLPVVNDTYEQFVNEREIDFLFTGSFRGKPQRTWSNYPKFVTSILDDVVDAVLSEDMLSFEQGLDVVLKAKQMELSPLHWKKINRILSQVNVYIHATRRYNALDTFAQAGIPIQIYGQGWDGMKDKWKSFSFKEEGTFEQTLDLLRKTKLVLNTNTHFVQGAHERVFAAMVNGAAVVSDVSKYYETHFTDEKDILLYNWTNLQAAPEKVQNYLSNPELLYNVAKNGQKLALEQHSWEARAQQLVDFVEFNLVLEKHVQEI